MTTSLPDPDDEHCDITSEDDSLAAQPVNIAKGKDMASVFQDLLKQRLPTQKDPVLARRTRLLSAPDEAALERKAHAILKRERKSILTKLHVLPDATADAARERALRRAATRGAVQLFNAVHKHQQAQDAQRDRQKPKKPITSALTASANSSCDFMDLLKKGPAKII